MIWSETPEYRKLVETRVEVLQACRNDKGRNDVLNQCWNDPVFWINNFAYTYDPRTTRKHLPFILFPKQVEYVKWIQYIIANGLDGLVEKSRDTGISYTTLAFLTWAYLFLEFNSKIGSRKEEYVDKPGDQDSLFQKIVYMLERLPSWMKPDGFNVDQHKTYMKLLHPTSSNTITGESANESFSRGGRQNIVVFDEFGFWPFARASWESAGETTPTRLAVSTPPTSGRASHMYKLASGQMGDVERFLFHARDDPRKDENWFLKTQGKKSREEYAREIDISYEGSTEGTVYAADFKLCEFGSFPYRPELPMYMFWDFGGDGTAMQWWQWDMKIDKWYLIDSYMYVKKPIEFAISFVKGEIKSLNGYDYSAEDIAVILRHKEWRKDITHYGDPDVVKTAIQRSDGKSTWDILRDAGIYVNYKTWAGGKKFYDMKQAATMFLRKACIDETNNEFFIYSINNARYPQRSEMSQATSSNGKPIHDETSHHRSAMEYGADNVPLRPGKIVEDDGLGNAPRRVQERFAQRKRATRPFMY